MVMRFMMAGIAVLLASAAAAQAPPPPPARIARIMAAANGQSPETAYKVNSVSDEYAILRALGLRPVSQSLVTKGKPYDVMEAEAADGKRQTLWFDISSFFGKF
jgi:hypothetical protein